MASLITPPPLTPGDTIGIAAPGAAFSKEAFQRGVARIEGLGYRTHFRDDIFQTEGYLAGSDSRRAEELKALFRDEGISAIFCARGGYGSQRILPMLDREGVGRNPKIFMGYSDITALHAYLQGVCGLVTFHGPLVTEMGGMDGDALRALFALLGRTEAWGELPARGIEVLRPGMAEGVLTGGSLSLFAVLLGTPYAPSTEGKILFFEDRGEKPYAVDRHFSHLRLAGVFKGARGLMLGKFIPPEGWSDGDARYEDEIRRIVLDAVGDSDFPVLANIPAGHVFGNQCFPLGVRVSIDGGRGTVSVIERCLGATGMQRQVPKGGAPVS